MRVAPHERDGLRATFRSMVDKITAVPKPQAGGRVGRLDDEDIMRPHQAVLAFLGLAVSPWAKQEASRYMQARTCRQVPFGCSRSHARQWVCGL